MSIFTRPISLFTRKKRTVALTIDEDAIRYVRIKSTEPLVLDMAKEVEIPLNTVVEGRIVDSGRLTTVLEEAVKEWGLAKRDVAFLAPDAYVIIRKVAYPANVEVEELKGHFFIEIGSTIYLPFDDPVFDVVPYTPNSKDHEAILIASKESVIQDYENVFEAVKLEPVVADIAPLSLYRLAFNEYSFTGDEHILLADLRGRILTVSIFHSHFPLFIRTMELEVPLSLTGETTHDEQVAPMTIVMELEKLANFYRYNLAANEGSITHLLWSGEYGQEEELLEMVRERLNIEGLPLVKTPVVCTDGTVISSVYHRTIGLALKEEV